MSELAEWSKFLQSLAGIIMLKDEENVEVDDDTGQIDLPMSVDFTNITDYPFVDVDEYVSFLQKSGILQRLLSLIPSTIQRPIFFYKLWPSNLRIVPILENGKIVFMWRGGDRSFVTCKLFRVKSPTVPQVDFAPSDRVVNCIIRSDIAWPITKMLGIEEIEEHARDVLDAGFDRMEMFKDAKGAYWVFPSTIGRRLILTESSGIRHPRKLPPKDEMRRIDDSKIYPPEYKLPEIDKEFVSPQKILQIVSNIDPRYSIPTKFCYLEMIVSILAMKVNVSQKDDIRDIFADNLHIFGYCRTPINVSFLKATDYWEKLLGTPEILYTYQSLRDELDQQIQMPLGGRRHYAFESDTVAPNVELKSLSIPFRSYEIVKSQAIQQLTRQVHSKIINEIMRERKVLPGSLEAKNIVTKEYERLLTIKEESELKRQVASMEKFIKGKKRWDEAVDWPAFDESDPKQVNIHGISFSIAEIRYVFHGTVLESIVETEAETNIEPTTISLEDAKLIKSFLEGSIPPEQFYSNLSDISFTELSIRFSYLDYYERPNNRALINFEFILGRPFVRLLQSIQDKFFASGSAPR